MDPASNWLINVRDGEMLVGTADGVSKEGRSSGVIEGGFVLWMSVLLSGKGRPRGLPF